MELLEFFAFTMNIYPAAPTNSRSLGFCGLNRWITFFVFVFICLGLFVRFENISLIRRRHDYRWKALNFDLYSAVMAIEQYGFFKEPHQLWHEPTLNGHLRGSVTLTSNAERLTVDRTRSPACEPNALPLQHSDSTLLNCHSRRAIRTGDSLRNMTFRIKYMLSTYGLWGGRGSLSCRVYCDTSSWFLRSHP